MLMPLPYPRLELAKRGSGLLPERTDERRVVLVGDLAGAMIELELLQGSEGAVALLGQLELPAGFGADLVQAISAAANRRLSEEREGDEDDACDREQRSEDEGSGHASARASARPYRSASRRSSRASGHSAIRAPARKTIPASQIRFTSGLTSTFR